VASFRSGFEQVFPLLHLSAFYEDEIEAMLCGTGAHFLYFGTSSSTAPS